MKRKIATTIVGALLFSGVGVATASTASAAPHTCPSTYACLWGDPSYKTGTGSGSTSRWIKFSRYIPNLASLKYEGTATSGANTASSVANNGTVGTAYFFVSPNKGGASFFLPKGQVNGDLRTGSAYVPSGGGFNDNIESAYFQAYL